jgi:hypothetical protein
MSEKTKYEILSAIDVSKHIEKKNGLSYLSWAWAVDQLLRADPAATWAYNDTKDFNGTLMVSCTVTAFGKPITMHLPVMDYRNKAIPSPDAFAVNTAMMRCLVKAIACHGLGLYIYAGEDLPEQEPASAKPITKDVWDSLDIEEQKYLQGIADKAMAFMDDKNYSGALAYLQSIKLDADEKTALFSRFPSNHRTELSKLTKR